jgi:uncharacterized protein (DUF983 family)
VSKPTEFNLCPECGEYRAHLPGADQCRVCDAVEAKKEGGGK